MSLSDDLFKRCSTADITAAHEWGGFNLRNNGESDSNAGRKRHLRVRGEDPLAVENN